MSPSVGSHCVIPWVLPGHQRPCISPQRGGLAILSPLPGPERSARPEQASLLAPPRPTPPHPTPARRR